MLIEHGVHNVDEGFVAGEKPVTPGEQITFEPALTHVLTEHFHHPAIFGKVFVGWKRLLHENFVSDFI